VDLTQQAAELDAADRLGAFRDLFEVNDDRIYLDGNSLGLMPRSVPGLLEDVTSQWTREAVLGWDTWLDRGLALGDHLAPVVGARAGEVAVCDQTSVNLYKLAAAALDATDRRDIVTDAGNFPSDRYVLEALARSRGGELVVAPEDAEVDELATFLDTDTALVALTHVAYRSGKMHDGAAVTSAAHASGALMLWDLAHSAGAVPVDLTGWGADLAVGCTYKYLNGGPGSPGFVYVRSDHHATLAQPIAGWFGHRDMFAFDAGYDADPSIRRFMVGTPAIVSMAGTQAGIEITARAGMEAIAGKATELTGLFIDGLAPLLGAGGLDLITPRDPARRGSHVAVRHDDGYRLSQALRAASVVVDFRAPDIVRFGFAPLYTTFGEVAAAIGIMEDLITSGSFRTGSATRRGVT